METGLRATAKAMGDNPPGPTSRAPDFYPDNRTPGSVRGALRRPYRDFAVLNPRGKSFAGPPQSWGRDAERRKRLAQDSEETRPTEPALPESYAAPSDIAG